MTTSNPVASKVMIIRHAEKPTTDPVTTGVDLSGNPDPSSLIPRGWQRAGALAVLFAPAKGSLQDSGLAVPQFIFASATTDPNENRPEETVVPLAGNLGITPDFSHQKTDLAGVSDAAMACAGTVLISWPHGEIPKLARQFPCSNHKDIPKEWPSDRFDVVFVLDLSGKSYAFSQVPQLLLAGDQSTPIPHKSHKSSETADTAPAGVVSAPEQTDDAPRGV